MGLIIRKNFYRYWSYYQMIYENSKNCKTLGNVNPFDFLFWVSWTNISHFDDSSSPLGL